MPFIMVEKPSKMVKDHLGVTHGHAGPRFGCFAMSQDRISISEEISDRSRAAQSGCSFMRKYSNQTCFPANKELVPLHFGFCIDKKSWKKVVAYHIMAKIFSIEANLAPEIS